MKLKPLPNTVVHVPTEEEYEELMSMYEDAGWRWSSGTAPMLDLSMWLSQGVNTHIRAKDGFSIADMDVLEKPHIITLKDFKKEQGLMKKELKEMQVGDVLLDNHNCERYVLEVMTQSFLPSSSRSQHLAAAWYTFEEAERGGWRFKDQPTPKKLTKAEIEEKLGYSVEIVEEVR